MNIKKIYKRLLHRIRFKITVKFRQPYFGPVLSARQLWRSRYPVMRLLIDEELSRGAKSYKILEIGSWAGQSAVLWASVCKEKKKGVLFVIDTWGASENAPEQMKRATKHNKIFSLFLHNIEVSGVKDYVVIIKGSSDSIADILMPETFNFVYIDGNHAYTQFKKDLLNYMKVVKINGVFCGDDLELRSNEVDLLNAKNHCEDDFIFDPKSKEWFHPGITLALNEVFGDVSMKNGFWALRKTKDGWETVSLSD